MFIYRSTKVNKINSSGRTVLPISKGKCLTLSLPHPRYSTMSISISSPPRPIPPPPSASQSQQESGTAGIDVFKLLPVTCSWKLFSANKMRPTHHLGCASWPAPSSPKPATNREGWTALVPISIFSISSPSMPQTHQVAEPLRIHTRQANADSQTPGKLSHLLSAQCRRFLTASQCYLCSSKGTLNKDIWRGAQGRAG